MTGRAAISSKTVGNPAEISKDRLRLWLRLLKASKGIEAELRERFRTEFDTTLPRFDVMAALHRSATGLKMSELSGVLRVSNGNVTGIIDRLVDDGLVVRVPVDSDRLAMTVRLAGRGRERFLQMAARHEVWTNELLGMIEPETIGELCRQLEHIAKAQVSREASA